MWNVDEQTRRSPPTFQLFRTCSHWIEVNCRAHHKWSAAFTPLQLLHEIAFAGVGEGGEGEVPIFLEFIFSSKLKKSNAPLRLPRCTWIYAHGYILKHFLL